MQTVKTAIVIIIAQIALNVIVFGVFFLLNGKLLFVEFGIAIK